MYAEKGEQYAKMLASNNARRARNAAYIDAQKARPCTDCGVQYPSYVMQFDHLEDHEKEAVISRLRSSTASLERVIAEIAKCEVVCANCHAERTFGRRRRVG